jgi:plastocyanin
VSLLVVVVLLGGSVLASTPALGANQTVTAATSGTSNTFTPADVTVDQGDTVTWNNIGGTHNVRFDDGSYVQPPAPQAAPWTVLRTFIETGTFRYYCALHGGPGGVGMSGTVTVAAVPYPRPGSGSPLRVPLVPAFAKCTSPNSLHVAPLDSPSCSPPALESPLLTTSTTGAGGGLARLDVFCNGGAPGETPPCNQTAGDQVDINIVGLATDVRRSSDGAAYSGNAILTTTIRITDKANGASGTGSATVQNAEFALPVNCATGNCNLNSTSDSLVPGFAQEGKRAVISTFSMNVKDAGPDGSIGAAGCAPNCGTGDEKVFLRQGVFAP